MNSRAGAWQDLSANSGTWARDDTSRLVFPLPETPDGEALWITDWRKTNVTRNDAAVRVVFWDDPVQVEVTGPEFAGEFAGREFTTASFTAKVPTYNTDAADYVTLTVSLFTDESKTALAKSKSVDVSNLGVVQAFDFTDLEEGVTYCATLSGADSAGNAGDDDSIVVVHIPWYPGAGEGKEESDGSTAEFAKWARQRQGATASTLTDAGCTTTRFELPASKDGLGVWRNDVNNSSAAFVMRLAYYRDPNLVPAMTILVLR